MTEQKKRSIHQYRPRGEAGAMPYSPQRDLANIYTPMLKEVFAGLDEPNWSPAIKEILSRYKITEAQLGEAVTVFVEAHRAFIRDRTVDSPATAFESAGIMRLPPAVRLVLFSRIGEVLMGGFFVALRDVTVQGQLTPGHDDLTAMIAAGRAVSARLSGHHPKVLHDALDKAQADAQEVHRTLAQSQAMVDELRRQILDNSKQLADQQSEIKKLRNYENSMIAYTERSWGGRLITAIRLGWDLLVNRKLA